MIIGVDGALEEGVSLFVGEELVFAGVGAGGGVLAQGLGEASVEAFGDTVGRGMEGFGQAVFDAVGMAELVEGMPAGGFAQGLAFHIDGEAVGELGAIVGEDGVDRMGEGLEEALEAGGDGVGVAALGNLDVDEAGGAIDGDEDIGGLALQPGKVLEVDVDEAAGNGGWSCARAED